MSKELVLLRAIANTLQYHTELLQAIACNIEDDVVIAKITSSMKHHTDALKKALEDVSQPPSLKESVMPNVVLDQLAAQVTATNGVIDSAVVLINGIASRIQSAVALALANGATAAELAPVTDEAAALKAKSDALAQAVASNP